MIKNIFIITLCGLLFAGCDYLEEIEPNDTIDSDIFWNTAESSALEQYCNEYYPRLIEGHGAPKSWRATKFISRDAASDNIYHSSPDARRSGQQLVQSTSGNWNWSIIRGCNIFLNNYCKSPASLSERNKYCGEILFFKTLDYWNKVKIYGDVPWYSTQITTQDKELLFKGRDSREVVMDSLLNCINRAISYLPVKKNVFRISKDAALALKARMCLYEGTYRRYRNISGDVKFLTAAYEAAGQLMQMGYSLYKGGDDPEQVYFNLFIQDSYNGNPEVILAREYSSDKDCGHNVSKYLQNYGMSRDAFNEYLCNKTGKPISVCGCPEHQPGAGTIGEMKDRDPRLLQTICIPEADNKHAYYLFKSGTGGAPDIWNVLVDDTEAPHPYNGSSVTGYNIAKYWKKEEEEKEGNHFGNIDAMIFRYAEVLLIRAEAAAELGLDPELDLTVNALRRRVGMTWELGMNPTQDPDLVAKYPNVESSNANLIREIRRERRVELFAEGLRWDDVCRWNLGEVLYKRPYIGAYVDPDLYNEKEIELIKEKVGVTQDNFIDVYDVRITYDLDFSDKYYLFNIPLDEVALNPSLLPNNPGW